MTAPRPIRVPKWSLSIRGKNVTGEIAEDVTSISYTDKLHGESDELSVDIENRDQQWLDAWFPTTGDDMVLEMGYDGEPLVRVGVLQLDEPTFSGPPHTVQLRGIAAPVSQALRTPRNVAYDGLTLRALAEDVAKRSKLTVSGFIQPITIERATQAGERDLAFLQRVALRHGYLVTVRGTDLVFTERKQLQDTGPIIGTYTFEDLARYQLVRKRTQTYKSCVVTWHDAVNNATIEGRAGAAVAEDPADASTDVLRVFERVESQQDADRVAASKLALANLGERTGTIDLEGEPRLLSGSRFRLEKAGKFSGLWQAKEVTHTVTRAAGFTTSAEVHKVG